MCIRNVDPTFRQRIMPFKLYKRNDEMPLLVGHSK